MKSNRKDLPTSFTSLSPTYKTQNYLGTNNTPFSSYTPKIKGQAKTLKGKASMKEISNIYMKNTSFENISGQKKFIKHKSSDNVATQNTGNILKFAESIITRRIFLADGIENM